MTVGLRDYQKNWVSDIIEAWQTRRVVLGVLQTGGGKTFCFSEIIRRHTTGELFGNPGAAVAVVHRKELVSQISCSLAKMGVKHRIVAPSKTVNLIRRKHINQFGSSFIDPHSLVGVASVQTLTSKSTSNDRLTSDWIKQCTLGVFDEGHHYVKAGIWGRAVEMLNRAKLLFVTATPERADGVGLGVPEQMGDGFAEVMIEGPTMRDMIDRGFLCRFTYKAPETNADFLGLAVGKNGDFNAKALRARVVDSNLVGKLVEHYTQFAPGKRAIVFSTDVATAEEQADEFRAAGYTAHALSGETEQGERDRVLAQFEGGELQVLVNVDLFDEGFDVPAVETVIMGRPTESLAKFLQMVGRGLRILEGKTEAVIIDAVRNWERHGMPTWPRVWTLAGRQKNSKSASDTIAQRVCRECTAPYPAFHLACPFCGATVPVVERSSPELVDGNLVELDVEAMDALFEKYRRANLTGEEYEQDQIARGVPSKYRRNEASHHNAVLTRRGVLKEVVGWWHGTQPEGRSEAEKQKRFFLRFGVDIMTAFTLNRAETDALITKIANSFGADYLQ